MSQVNLDALIKREDLFKITEDSHLQANQDISSLRIDADLTPGKSHTYKTLRKPDFQRETSEWKPERIVKFIKSFINDDIIPAVILWHWKGNNFIIDGGHRLSAIIAWVLDDYGDGEISKRYFGDDNISKEQKSRALKTRRLIENDKDIKPFKSYEYDFNNPEKVSQAEYTKASNILVSRSIQVQWIRANTSEAAEESFFRINGEASPINDTETMILKSRKKPNAIGARAIIHSGSAHKYWKGFEEDRQKEIERIAAHINSLLFEPELDPTVTHFPIAGNGYASHSLELVFGIMNMINGLEELNSKRNTFIKKKPEEIIPEEDVDGSKTVLYLNKVERILRIIGGKQDSVSLALSPLIYFYNLKGRFQITSFLAIVHLMAEWEHDRQDYKKPIFQRFCSVRDKFEDFLLRNKHFTTEATLNIGSGIKSYKQLSSLYEFVINSLLANDSESDIINKIQEDERFSFIKKVESDNSYEDGRKSPGKRIPKETRNEVVIKTFLGKKITCPICGGHATFERYNIDHIKAIRDNGLGEVENLQLTHPYCNAEKETVMKLKDELTKLQKSVKD